MYRDQEDRQTNSKKMEDVFSKEESVKILLSQDPNEAALVIKNLFDDCNCQKFRYLFDTLRSSLQEGKSVPIPYGQICVASEWGIPTNKYSRIELWADILKCLEMIEVNGPFYRDYLKYTLGIYEKVTITPRQRLCLGGFASILEHTTKASFMEKMRRMCLPDNPDILALFDLNFDFFNDCKGANDEYWAKLLDIIGDLPAYMFTERHYSKGIYIPYVEARRRGYCSALTH